MQVLFLYFLWLQKSKEEQEIKRKEHNKVVILARSKLDIIDTVKSQALTDLEISHEEYKTIIKEEKNDGNLKVKIRTIESDAEKDELNKKEDKKKKNECNNYKWKNKNAWN